MKLNESGHGWFTVVCIFLGGKEANLTQNNVIYLTAENTLVLTVSRRTGLNYYLTFVSFVLVSSY